MVRGAVFIVLMAIALVGGVASRFFALLAYLWFALFRPQDWVWWDVSRWRLSLVLGGLLVLPSLASGILPNITHPLTLGSLLFLLCGLIAQVNAVRPDVGWQWLDYLARLILVCGFLVTIVNSKRRYLLTVAVIAASFGFYPAKAGMASMLGGGLRYAAGLTGAFSDNNGYALGTAMVMPLLLATAQNLSRSRPFDRWFRIGFYLSVPLSAFTVVSTFSRGGFLALAVATFVYVILQKRKTIAMIGLGLALSTAFIALPIGQGYVRRLETIRNYEKGEDQSALGRLHFWYVAIEMARGHPLGIGLWNYAYAYDRYDDTDGAFGRQRAVHSSHFQVLAETGFPGIAVWVFLFAAAGKIAWRIRRRAQAPTLCEEDQHFLFTMSNALLVSMSGFVVGGAFLALALNDITWLTFALIAALDRLSVRMLSDPKADTSKPSVIGTRQTVYGL